MQAKDLTGFGEIHAILGRGTEFEGKLTFDGRVRIDGAFRGEIWSEGMLVLGDGSQIDARIEVGTLTPCPRPGALRHRRPAALHRQGCALRRPMHHGRRRDPRDRRRPRQ
ncbi:MAG: polymer-forming cytoskeletal protein [Deltaproteobacteria bacterium]|nr:polymer-forming cytoskeletal protein [Deltaproteobacteria bacterium]